MRFFKVSLFVMVVGVFVWLGTFRSAKAQNPQQPFVQQITLAGTSSFQAAAAGNDTLDNLEVNPGLDFTDDGSGISTSQGTGTAINRTIGQGEGEGRDMNENEGHGSKAKLLVSFDGLNHRNQRLANGGNQFSLEPPDQGLCAGNGFVLETVNDVLRVFDTSGNPLTGVVDLNTFYGYPAAIKRSPPVAFGPEITDPSCYFDRATQRWFVVVLTLDDKPKNGAFTGPNHLDLAVSKTSSPLGAFNIYRLPVQDDGTQGTPNHGCTGGPCFGDYPHMGADANGIYLTTNEFNFFAPGFRGSQIYAISKRALASGAVSVAVTQFDTANNLLDGHPGHTVWPAISPDLEENEDGGGREFFLSSVAVFSSTGTDNRIRVWKLRHTQSIDDASPNLTLDSSIVPVDTYGRPPQANQKVGDFPLGQCINDTTTTITSLGPPFTGCWKALFGGEPAHTEAESNHVDANDSRMQQVIFADGKLYGALDTAINVGGATKAGVAFYVIRPGEEGDGPRVVRQGALGLANNNLTYPAVGVTESGRGVIAFTLLGADNFPSAAFASLNAEDGAGPIQIAAAGLGPDDGFTAYKAEVGNTRNRWGDYGAAVADGKNIWIASEYINQTCTLAQYIAAPFGSCGGTRTTLGNWGTRISEVKPSH